MLNVKFETEHAEGRDLDTSPYIVVDDISDLKSHCYKASNGEWKAHIYSDKVYTRLSSYSIADIAEYLEEFTYTGNEADDQFTVGIEVQCRPTKYTKSRIYVKFEFRVELWAKPYGIQRFSEIFQGLVEDRKVDGVFYEEEDELGVNGFGIWVPISDQNRILKDAVDLALSIFTDFQASAEATAIDSLDRDNLVTLFSFPEGFKVACKQYLMYFAQFLFDLGVEADTEIKEEGRQT